MSVRKRAIVCVVIAAIFGGVFGPLRSDAANAAPSCNARDGAAVGDRIVHRSIRFHGIEQSFDILVPPGYAASTRRYPVLYLLHGGTGQSHNSWFVHTDVVGFTETLPDGSQAIVVTPEGGYAALWADWPDGIHSFETFDVDVLVPYVDAHFRTLADRSHRAVAGLSAGALGATAYAARHPDVFSVAGGFSGGYPGDDLDLGSLALVQVSAAQGALLCDRYSPEDAFGPYGNYATNEIRWRNDAPLDLLTNYAGVFLYLASGNGVPCDQEDRAALASGATPPVETTLGQATADFDARLTSAGIAHETDLYGCGVHSWRYWQRDLHRFWPTMIASFGKRAPSRFDYRRADARFSVWGWSFRADPHRPDEFLDLDGVTSGGFRMTGSGVTTVTTPRLFRRGALVTLTGATVERCVADRAGSITFSVDLGAPHQFQEYSVQSRIADEPFVSRTVTIAAASRRSLRPATTSCS